jgi:uncharacterized protein
MALDYFAPGVYVEEVDRGSRPIEGISMSVAGFIGFTEDVRGDAELFKPQLITTWGQYLECFARPGSDGFTDFDAYLPFAVQGWFQNGGGRCWVTSIGTKLPGMPAPNREETATNLLTSAKKPSLQMNLRLPEVTAADQAALPPVDRIVVTVEDSDPKPQEEIDPDAEAPFNSGEYFKVTVRSGDRVLESFPHLTMKSDVETRLADYVEVALAESAYLEVANISGEQGQPLTRRPANGRYEVAPPPYIAPLERLSRDLQGARDERKGIQGVFEIDEVGMIACPDLMRVYQDGLMELDQVHAIMEMMVSQCENSFPGPAYRMVVLDPPPVKLRRGADAVAPEDQRPQDVAQWLSQFNRRSMFGALYYPWIKVANPRNNNDGNLVSD